MLIIISIIIKSIYLHFSGTHMFQWELMMYWTREYLNTTRQYLNTIGQALIFTSIKSQDQAKTGQLNIIGLRWHLRIRAFCLLAVYYWRILSSLWPLVFNQEVWERPVFTFFTSIFRSTSTVAALSQVL